MINWKEKLGSRKFWVMVVGVLIPLINTWNGSPMDSNTLICAVAVLVGYLFAQGAVDIAEKKNGGSKPHLNAARGFMEAIKALNLEIKPQRKPRGDNKPQAEKSKTERLVESGAITD